MAAPLLAIFAPVITWIFRDIVIKFLVFSAIFALVALLVPYAVQYLGGFISKGGLENSFSQIGPGVWWFLDCFNITSGLPLIISAYVSRFMIRRLPVIG